MKCVKITPAKLQGEISVPSSKSISHRMLICSSLAGGESTICNLLCSDDTQATIGAMKALGAKIRGLSNSDCGKGRDIFVTGNDFPKVTEGIIDCKESASTLRLTIPVAAITGERVTFTGRGGLCRRPLGIYLKIFDEQNIEYTAKDGELPLTFAGRLTFGEYRVRGDISSQFISGLLLALPLLKGDSKIVISGVMESKGYIDLTLDVMNKFSVVVENRNYNEFVVKGNQKYIPGCHRVEGDFSQGAFWLAAGLLGDEVFCRGLEANSLQGDKAILEIIHNMGAEAIADGDCIAMRPCGTFGAVVDASQCPDLVPVIAVLGAFGKGTTRIVKAERLRIKESDRLKAMAKELSKLGAWIRETQDGLIISGQDMLKGGTVNSWGDHRIAMALAIASIRCEEPVVIENSDVISKSYPDFWRDFIELGGIIDEFDFRE